MTEEEKQEQRRRRAALLLVPLLLLGAACCFWSLFANVALGEAEAFIPAPLGSDALANYGEDDIPGRLRSLSISIVEAVIRDRDPEEENVDDRVEDVSDSLKSPVPTVTPKPGDPTGTPTSPPTTTFTPDLSGTGTITATVSPSPTRIASRTPTPTETDVPTVGPSPTPAPPCKVPPYIEILAPTPDQHFTLAEDLPGQAFAFDPDNVDPVTCDPALATFPSDDGVGLPGDPEVHFIIEWDEFGDRSSWVLVHEMYQDNDPFCAFTGGCDVWDLSTGQWPDSTPINIGRHRIKAKALRDDESPPDISSGWHIHEFYIDPAPTATPSITPIPSDTPTPTASNTPIPTSTDTPTPTWTPTLTPTNTPILPTSTFTPTPDVCSLITINNYDSSGSQHITWDIQNDNAAVFTLSAISITWPGGNGDLTKVKLGGPDIWSGDDDPPSANLSLSGTVPIGGPTELRFDFESSTAASGYNATITIGPCSIPISG